jgi:hypothetical protein
VKAILAARLAVLLLDHIIDELGYGLLDALPALCAAVGTGDVEDDAADCEHQSEKHLTVSERRIGPESHLDNLFFQSRNIFFVQIATDLHLLPRQIRPALVADRVAPADPAASNS